LHRILLLVLFACLPLPLASQTSPERFKIAGLRAPVEVVRDKYGIPHIYAQNQHDLFFAQGYVAASDRLFQMELWKRVGQGRLAEVLGKEFVQRDRVARLLRYRGDMEAEYSSYAPDAKQILSSFVAGINAYIAQSVDGDGSNLPLEFKLAGFKPEPWRPEDCLSRMAAYGVTGNAEDELLLANAVTELGVDGAEKLAYLDPKASLRPPPGVDYRGLTAAITSDFIGSDRRIPVKAQKGATGSNNWTISGALTSTGKPLLANDPHRTIAVPALRYLVHLVAPGWNVIGAGEPALPGVAIGHNQHIAWGLTIFGADQQDFFVETLHPEDPTQYRTDSGWERMRIEEEVIPVRGGAEVTTELKFTRHGPVVWEDKTTRRALALRWVGAEPGTAGYLASLAVDRARNWTEFRNAMMRWKMPPENMVYADTKGNIGEISGALAPIRPKSNGLLPVPGTGGYEWHGFIPFEDLPQSFNPKRGFIATANHKMLPDNYKYAAGFDWSSFRIQRVEDVLDGWARSKRKFSMQDMKALQNDVFSIPARTLIGLLAESDHPDVRLLKSWNFELTSDSSPAALYEVWWKHLSNAVYSALVPSKNPALRDIMRNERVVQYLEASPERDKMLLGALAAAARELEELQGADRRKWNWGSLHALRLQHSLEQFKFPAYARPGDAETVNSTSNSRTSFAQTSGASFRELIDLSAWDKSLVISTPGQSGTPGNKHYDDLMQLWLEGDYFPLAFSRPAVTGIAEHTIILEPRRGQSK
jgi:penicillin G amidase